MFDLHRHVVKVPFDPTQLGLERSEDNWQDPPVMEVGESVDNEEDVLLGLSDYERRTYLQARDKGDASDFSSKRVVDSPVRTFAKIKQEEQEKDGLKNLIIVVNKVVIKTSPSSLQKGKSCFVLESDSEEEPLKRVFLGEKKGLKVYNIVDGMVIKTPPSSSQKRNNQFVLESDSDEEFLKLDHTPTKMLNKEHNGYDMRGKLLAIHSQLNLPMEPEMFVKNYFKSVALSMEEKKGLKLL